MPGIFGSRRQQPAYGGRRGGSLGGLKFRLLIAGAFVLFALFSFYGMSQPNPVTGEKQRVAMDVGDEQRMGLNTAPQMIQQHGGEDGGPNGRHVHELGTRLLNSLDSWLAQQGKSLPYQFDFHLLNDQRSINAFALPGGQVFITQALYSKLETDGQLAGVLGHEIGHVIERHGSERMAKQKFTQMLTGAAGVAGGGVDSARAAAAVGKFVNMKYGRNDELESDTWGVRLCVLAGFDPNAMKGVMKILDEASGGAGPPEMMSTHPKPKNRIAYIESVIEREFPEGLPRNLKP